MQIDSERIDEQAKAIIRLITNVQRIKHEIKQQEWLLSINPNVFVDINHYETLYVDKVPEILSGLSYVDVVKKILTLNFPVRKKGCFGQTLLHFFCFDYECSKLLIEAGADVNEDDDFFDPPLAIFVKNLDAFRVLHTRLELVNIVKLHIASGYHFGGDILIDYLRDRTDLKYDSDEETEFAYLLVQHSVEPNKQYKILKEIMRENSRLNDFYMDKQISALRDKVISSASQAKNFYELMHFYNGLSKEQSWQYRLELITHILEYDYLPHELEDLPFEELKALSYIARPQSLLDVVKALVPEKFAINTEFCDSNLLHIMVRLEEYDVAAWLIDQGIDLNAENDSKCTAFEDLIGMEYAEENIKLCLKMLEQPSFETIVSIQQQTTYFRILCVRLTYRMLNHLDRELLIKLAKKTYSNPGVALVHSFPKDEEIISKASALLKNPELNNGAKLTYQPNDRNKELPATSKQQTRAPAELKSKKNLLQLFVSEGMRSSLTYYELKGSKEAYTIIAYRLIGMVTNVSLNDVITRGSGTQFQIDPQSQLDRKALQFFYNGRVKGIIAPYRLSSIVPKILELKFNVNTKGSFGQTLLHLVVPQLNTHAIHLLLKAGAKVNAQDSLLETPLHKMLQILEISYTSPNGKERYEDFIDIIKMFSEFGADFDLESVSFETPLNMALKHLSGVCSVNDKSEVNEYLKFVALLLIYTKKDPIVYLNWYYQYASSKNELNLLLEKIEEVQQQQDAPSDRKRQLEKTGEVMEGRLIDNKKPKVDLNLLADEIVKVCSTLGLPNLNGSLDKQKAKIDEQIEFISELRKRLVQTIHDGKTDNTQFGNKESCDNSLAKTDNNLKPSYS